MISATHLHAMLVHFPIALLFAGFFFEILAFFSKKPFFRQAGLYLLVLGAAGAAASYFSGNAAGDGLEEGSLGQAVALHEAAATRTLVIVLIAAAVRIFFEIYLPNHAGGRIAAFLLFAGSIGAVAQTGYLGGQLVYKHAAGIELGVDNFSGEPSLKE